MASNLTTDPKSPIIIIIIKTWFTFDNQGHFNETINKKETAPIIFVIINTTSTPTFTYHSFINSFFKKKERDHAIRNKSQKRKFKICIVESLQETNEPRKCCNRKKKNSLTGIEWMMAHTNTAEPIQEQIKERQEQEKRQHLT